MLKFLIHRPVSVTLVFFVLIISASCQFKQEMNDKQLEKIIISEDLINNETDYSNIINSIEVIPLETNENSIMSDIWKIEYRNDKYYLHDHNQVLFIFDSKGNFITKLDKRGRGPKEYQEMRDFSVDDDGLITILSTKAFLTYDSTLEFIGKRKFNITSKTGRDLNPIRFFPTKDHIFLFMGSFGLHHIEPGKESTIYCINRNDEIIREFFPLTSGLTGHQSYYRSGNAIYYSHSYGNDTIYSVSENDIKPALFVDFLNKRITEKEMMGDRSELFDKIWKNDYKGLILNPFENETYISFSFASGRNRKLAVQNKKSGELKIINVGKTTPFPMIFPEGICNKSFFSHIQPLMFSIYNKDGIYDDILKKHNISNIDISDNPIIVKFNFNF